MKTWTKAVLCISLSFMCLFTCIGYAVVSGNLSVFGNATLEPSLPDVYITSITPTTSAGVTVTSTTGTVMYASISGSGTATFEITVKNISDKFYVYERVVDGKEAGFEGVYDESDITYEIDNLTMFHELTPASDESNEDEHTFTVEITVPRGVTTDKAYVLYFKFIEKTGMEILPDDYVNVVFKTNNNKPDVITKVVRNELVPRPETPIRSGYEFVGWYIDEEYTTPWYFDIDKITDNLTLYAKWEQSRYTIQFEPNNGEPLSKKTVWSGSLIELPAIPEKTGFTFIGWYTDAACSPENAWNFDTDMPVSDMTLYAGWEEYKEPVKPYLYITFHPYPDSDTGVYTVEILTGAFVPRQSTPEKDGFVFMGWYADTNYTIAWNFEANKPTDDMHLYALWRTVAKYTVTFNPLNDTASTSITVEEGNHIPLPEQPTRKGYTFMGWYKDSSYTTAWNFYADKPTSDMTLYAKWEEYKVTTSSDIRGLAQAFLNENITNSLNNSDEIYDNVKDVKTPSNRTDAPVLHCTVPNIGSGTLGSFTNEANAGLDSYLDFIVMVDPNNPERLFVYMYYADDCISSNTGKRIDTYLQAFAYNLDENGNKVWYEDGTYKGTAVVGKFLTGQNKNKTALMIDAHSWQADTLTIDETP